LCCFQTKNPEAWVLEHQIVRLADILISHGKPQPQDQVLLETFWLFPDANPPQRNATRTRLELHPFANSDSLKKLFPACYIAYRQLGRRMIVHVYTPTIPSLQTIVHGSVEYACVLSDRTVETSMPYAQLITDERVQLSTLYCNQPLAVANVLGISAARVIIIKEIHKVLNAYGVYLDTRHIGLLADYMTVTGYVLPVTRHGMRKSTDSTLRRCKLFLFILKHNIFFLFFFNLPIKFSCF
jgi:hypothetical protein